MFDGFDTTNAGRCRRSAVYREAEIIAFVASKPDKSISTIH